jgi:hypothetical protein
MKTAGVDFRLLPIFNQSAPGRPKAYQFDRRAGTVETRLPEQEPGAAD